jgi:hypothetical protein
MNDPHNAGATQPLPVAVPDLRSEPRAWTLPNVAEILEPGREMKADDEYDKQRAHIIEETLSSFGAPAGLHRVARRAHARAGG